MAKKRLTRDKVISVLGSPSARKKKEADGSEILFECSPEKADRIIEIFNCRVADQALEKLEQRGKEQGKRRKNIEQEEDADGRTRKQQ